MANPGSFMQTSTPDRPRIMPLGPFVAYGHELLLDLSKLGTHSLADWLPPEHEARAAPTGRAIMRKPQEVERLRLAETLSTAICNCASTELDEPRLVGVKGEPEACEPCL